MRKLRTFFSALYWLGYVLINLLRELLEDYRDRRSDQ